MRVLVVRAREQAGATAERLAASGYDPLVAPILGIVPIDTPLPRALPDAVAVTSRNAVPALARHLGRLASVPVFAIGARTGAALVEAGFGQVSVAGPDGAALAHAVAASLPAGAVVLHAAGRDRRPEPEATLRARGFRPVTWLAYRARAASRLPEDIAQGLRDGSLGAVLHYSARSATLLVRLVREAGLAAPFGALAHACLSGEVADALGNAARRIAVADAPDETHLLGALADVAGRAGSPAPQSRC